MATPYPKIYNHGTPKFEDNGRMVTFTYLDSWNTAHTITLSTLTPYQIVEKVKIRHKQFKENPGRESDPSRFQRKYISAQLSATLLKAWQMMDGDARMEFSMMLDASSHHGISDKEWAEAHQTHELHVRGDDGRPL